MPRAAIALSGLSLLTFLVLGGACSSAQLVDSRVTPTGSGGDDSSGDGGGAGDGQATSSDGASGHPGSPPPSTANATVMLEPSDNGTAIVNAIKNAKKSVHVTMYLLSDSSAISALIAQKKAGHDVKVVLNKTSPDGSIDNQDVYNQLTSNGVSVAWAPGAFTFTHAKCVIVDSAQAWVMTMNLTYSSPENREYLALDTDATDVQNLESLFADDSANKSHIATGNLIVAPLNASDRIKALIESATKSLDVEVEELSDDGVTQAIVDAVTRGVKARVVLSNETPTSAQADSIATLKQQKVPVVSLAKPYVHAKAIVADGTLAYVGSANFTTTSLKYNREIGLVLSTASEVGKVASTIGSDFSAGTAL